MPVSQIWKMDKIVLGASLTFDQFESQEIDPAVTAVLLRPAGHPHALAVSTQMIQPIIRFQTPQLDIAAGIPLTGVAYTADSYVYLAQSTSVGVSGKTARATTSHARIVASEMVAYIESINLPNRGQGLATIVCCAVYDGTNAPLVHGGTIALPGNLDAVKQFGCGPASITIAGPTTVDFEATEINITTGVQLHKLSAASDLYDTLVSINTCDPVIDIRSASELAIDNFGVAGAALDGSTGLVAYGRLIGPRTADGSSVHLKIDAIAGSVFPGAATTEDNRWTDRVMIKPIAGSDSVQPVILTASSAIA